MTLPVLSGGRGGYAAFVAPTSGFLFGWVFAAFVTGFLSERLVHGNQSGLVQTVSFFLAAMIGYFTKVFLLGVVLVLFRDADWLAPLAFAVTAIAVSLASTVGEIVAFTRVRPLIYDEPAEPGDRR